MIRVLLADDHALVREGLKALFSATDDVHVVGETDRGDGILAALARTPADVLVMDVSMPGPGFLETLEQLRARARGTRVLVLSMHAESRFALRAFRAGASGYVEKGRAPADVVEAVRRVARGRRYVSPALAERLLDVGAAAPHDALSSREFEVLRSLAAGQTPKEIAQRLGVSPKTISTYRVRILGKLGLDGNADLVRYVLEAGLLE